MKNIADEIRSFLERTGLPQARLAEDSGIAPSAICNLLKGNRKNLIGSNQDKLRASMGRLAENNCTVLEESRGALG